MIKSLFFLLSFLMPLPVWSQRHQRFGGMYQGESGSSIKKYKAPLNRAKSLYYQGKYGAAIRIFNSVLESARQANNLPAASQAWEGLGLTHNAFQNFPMSIVSLRMALQINTTLGNPRGTIRIEKYISDVYYSKRAFDSALYYAAISMQLATATGINEYTNDIRLGTIAALVRLKQWDKAGREIAAFKAGQDTQQLKLQVQLESMEGNFYLGNGQEKKALGYYSAALEHAKTYDELSAVVYGHMIDSYYEKKDYKKAWDCYDRYKKSRSLLQPGEIMPTVFHTDLYKLQIYNLNIEKKLADLELQQETAENKSKELRLQQGKQERASLELENRSKDSLLVLKDSLLATNALLVAVQQKEAEKEKKLNSAINREKDNEIRYATQLNNVFIGGFATALLLGGIIYYQYTRQKRKNSIIENQKEELQTLMKEIHHRVKNNLQVISSLLDLQSQTITDSQASEAIKEGKNRVLSMALIHQNLYGDHSIQKINVKAYIHSLSKGLIDSYNIQPDRISIHTDIDDLDLDVDTVVPLGLILNELISNSLKHGFGSGRKGKIGVTLKEKEGALYLKVADNGSGFPGGKAAPQPTSFGMKLIRAFAAKLKAKVDMYNEEGASVVLHIHKYKTAS